MLLGDLFELSLRGRAGTVGLIRDGPNSRRELTCGKIGNRRTGRGLRQRRLESGDRLAGALRAAGRERRRNQCTRRS